MGKGTASKINNQIKEEWTPKEKLELISAIQLGVIWGIGGYV